MVEEKIQPDALYTQGFMKGDTRKLKIVPAFVDRTFADMSGYGYVPAGKSFLMGFSDMPCDCSKCIGGNALIKAEEEYGEILHDCYLVIEVPRNYNWSRLSKQREWLVCPLMHKTDDDEPANIATGPSTNKRGFY